MKSRALVLVAAACVLSVPVFAADSPYAGQQDRPIKALSDEDIAALRKGEGMGMAKAAELNGYPGPTHVLELASQLALTPEQVQQITAIQHHMSHAAQKIGMQIVERERALDGLFAGGQITPETLRAATGALADLQGTLRAAHLTAHLETRALLTPEQIALYQKLRGYGDPAAPEHHHHG